MGTTSFYLHITFKPYDRKSLQSPAPQDRNNEHSTMAFSDFKLNYADNLPRFGAKISFFLIW